MVAIRLKGFITETGSIEVEIPKDFPAGEVMLTIEAVAPDDEQLLTEAEILELMRPNPKTGAEIAQHLSEMEPLDPNSPYGSQLDSLVIVRMMRTSIWDVYVQILKDIQD